MPHSNTIRLTIGTICSGFGVPLATIMDDPELSEVFDYRFSAEIRPDEGQRGPDDRNSRNACAVLAARSGAPNLGDIIHADPPAVEVAVTTCSCTPFSGANRHAGGRLEGAAALFVEAAKMVGRSRADYVILENTDRLLCGTHAPYWEEMKRVYRQMGFRIADGKLDPRSFGNHPNARTRLYAIMARGRQDIVDFIEDRWPREFQQEVDWRSIDWGQYLRGDDLRDRIVKADTADAMLRKYDERIAAGRRRDNLDPLVRAALENAARWRPGPDARPARPEPVFWQRVSDGVDSSVGLCPTITKSGTEGLGVVQRWSDPLAPGGSVPFARRLTGWEMERLLGLPGDWSDLPGLDDDARGKLCGNSMHVEQVRWCLKTLVEAIRGCGAW
jgi:site-specific DNA-cytosine methylase